MPLLQVHLMGKPAPIIYDSARQQLGLAPSEVIAIGDSLEHDVAGAAAAGIDSLFVGGGIHAGELGISRDGSLTAPSRTVGQLCAQLNVQAPTFAVPYLVT